MKTIIAEGATPELAFNKQADFELVSNATKLFLKSGLDLDGFAKDYLTGVDDAEGYGAYIVLREPKKTKTPKTKFKVENFVNKTVRKWETITNFMKADETIILKYPSKGTTKAKSIAKAKELSAEHNCAITVLLTKQVNTGSPITAIVTVSPDINTEGRYYFFGVENLIDTTEE